MRQIAANDSAVKRGEWSTPSTRVQYGKTLGIVGLGRVGPHVARIGAAFGMCVLAWGPRPSDPIAGENGSEFQALDRSLCLPGTR